MELNNVLNVLPLYVNTGRFGDVERELRDNMVM
jgi:hypothetical protein